MTTRCENCHGEGLVGAGDQPWLRQGPVTTCSPCGGTGKVDEEIVKEASQDVIDGATTPEDTTDLPTSGSTDEQTDVEPVAPTEEDSKKNENTGSDQSETGSENTQSE